MRAWAWQRGAECSAGAGTGRRCACAESWAGACWRREPAAAGRGARGPVAHTLILQLHAPDEGGAKTLCMGAQHPDDLAFASPVVVFKQAPERVRSSSAGSSRAGAPDRTASARENGRHYVAVDIVETDRSLHRHMHGQFVHVSANCGCEWAQPCMQGCPACYSLHNVSTVARHASLQQGAAAEPGAYGCCRQRRACKLGGGKRRVHRCCAASLAECTARL